VAAVAETIAAIRGGQPVILPTDTVYGLCATPFREGPVARLSRLKGRAESQPIALVAADLDLLLECVPELRGRADAIARALLPGPYTLILTNPARRFRWLNGPRPDTIGVRVPEWPGEGAAVLAAVGAVAATSANEHGDPDPRRLDDVPGQIRARCAAAVDAGELPGTASTVLDFSGEEPRVLREGAAPGAAAIDRALKAVA
jgi:L-threonylcarbamoyladenylate synthase